MTFLNLFLDTVFVFVLFKIEKKIINVSFITECKISELCIVREIRLVMNVTVSAMVISKIMLKPNYVNFQTFVSFALFSYIIVPCLTAYTIHKDGNILVQLIYNICVRRRKELIF